MTSRTRPKIVLLALSLLLFGLFTPILATGGSGTGSQSSAQLSALIASAEGSGAYARSMVTFASSNGLTVTSLQALISQGDALLATAREDDQSGSISAGIQAVQAAMKDYTSAAASSSLAASQAGLLVGVDYSAVEQAVAEVNTTVTAAASVASTACAQVGGPASQEAALVQACASVESQIAGARANLTEAASLAAQANGQANAGLDIQAMAFVAAARAEVNETQAEFQTIASYGYSQRGAAYVTAVLGPLSSQADATIAGEESVNSSFYQLQGAYLNYAQEHEFWVGSITASAGVVAAAILGVNTDAVSSSASAADGVAAQVGSNMTALLALSGISVLPNVVADVRSCQSLSGAFTLDVDAAAAQSLAYQQTTLPSFSTYLGLATQDAANVQSGGNAYVSACAKVVTDLSSLTGVPGVSAVYSNLASLQMSSSAAGITSSMNQEVSAMSTASADITEFTSAVAAQMSYVNMSSSFVARAGSDAAGARAYLNATASAAMSQASLSMSLTWQGALTLSSELKSLSTATIGVFNTKEAAFAIDGNDTAEFGGTASAMAAAAAYLRSDLSSRVAANAAAQSEEALAARLFSTLDVQGGVSALAQASLDFRTATTVYAK